MNHVQRTLSLKSTNGMERGWGEFSSFTQLFLKLLNRIANSVDPDRTTQEYSDLGLYCLHTPFCQNVSCIKSKDIYLIPLMHHFI